MQILKSIDWEEPLELAKSVHDNEKTWAFLYSGGNEHKNKKSILALCADEEIAPKNFDELEQKLTCNQPDFANARFGFVGYGAKNYLENLPKDEEYDFDFPDIWFAKYNLILVFNHEEKKIDVWAKSSEYLKYIPQTEKKNSKTEIKTHNLSSNMTKDEYLNKVEKIRSHIKDGTIYQANLTRKFSGNIDRKTRKIDIFAKLCEISPSDYSAFFKIGDKYILSSSPEQFVKIDKSGEASMMPIKGSARRFDEKQKDQNSRENLSSSEKDKAENLMIVDLCRNDMSRSCEIGSVRVENLFEIKSYATVHHMVSTVLGQKKSGESSLGLVKSCFPPGSMTGTPKIKAMEICTELEKLKRGVYSGAIGWFGGDGSVDLSVVIRTILFDGDDFEFQVGGAIVIDSTPQNEWQETITKAKAVSKALNIKLDDLKII